MIESQHQTGRVSMRNTTRMVLALAIMVAGVTISQAAATTDKVDKPGNPYGITRKPIPEKLVVLTFDDSCASHATFVGPLLKKYGFGGTFYVSDAFAFRTRKDWYMTWQQIKALDGMGFEIGNHTIGHGSLGVTSLEGCTAAATGIEDECRANNVPETVPGLRPGCRRQFVREQTGRMACLG